jgi:hypothetical protein
MAQKVQQMLARAIIIMHTDAPLPHPSSWMRGSTFILSDGFVKIHFPALLFRLLLCRQLPVIIFDGGGTRCCVYTSASVETDHSWVTDE